MNTKVNSTCHLSTGDRTRELAKLWRKYTRDDNDGRLGGQGRRHVSRSPTDCWRTGQPCLGSTGLRAVQVKSC